MWGNRKLEYDWRPTRLKCSVQANSYSDREDSRCTPPNPCHQCQSRAIYSKIEYRCASAPPVCRRPVLQDHASCLQKRYKLEVVGNSIATPKPDNCDNYTRRSSLQPSDSSKRKESPPPSRRESSPPPTRRESSTPSGGKKNVKAPHKSKNGFEPPEHEYIHFLLNITEDILRNNLYTVEELDKLFESHIAANKGRLNEAKMRQKVAQLKKELDLPLPARVEKCPCSDNKRTLVCGCSNEEQKPTAACQCNKASSPQVAPAEENKSATDQNEPFIEGSPLNLDGKASSVDDVPSKLEESEAPSEKQEDIAPLEEQSESLDKDNDNLMPIEEEGEKESCCSDQSCDGAVCRSEAKANTEPVDKEEEVHPVEMIWGESLAVHPFEMRPSRGESPEQQADSSQPEQDLESKQKEEYAKELEDLQKQLESSADESEDLQQQPESSADESDLQQLPESSADESDALPKVADDEGMKTTEDGIQYYNPKSPDEICLCMKHHIQNKALKIVDKEEVEYVLVDGPVCIPKNMLENQTITVLLQNSPSMVLTHFDQNKTLEQELSASRTNLFQPKSSKDFMRTLNIRTFSGTVISEEEAPERDFANRYSISSALITAAAAVLENSGIDTRQEGEPSKVTTDPTSVAVDSKDPEECTAPCNVKGTRESSKIAGTDSCLERNNRRKPEQPTKPKSLMDGSRSFPAPSPIKKLKSPNGSRSRSRSISFSSEVDENKKYHYLLKDATTNTATDDSVRGLELLPTAKTADVSITDPYKLLLDDQYKNGDAEVKEEESIAEIPEKEESEGEESGKTEQLAIQVQQLEDQISEEVEIEEEDEEVQEQHFPLSSETSPVISAHEAEEFSARNSPRHSIFSLIPAEPKHMASFRPPKFSKQQTILQPEDRSETSSVQVLKSEKTSRSPSSERPSLLRTPLIQPLQIEKAIQAIPPDSPPRNLIGSKTSQSPPQTARSSVESSASGLLTSKVTGSSIEFGKGPGSPRSSRSASLSGRHVYPAKPPKSPSTASEQPFAAGKHVDNNESLELNTVQPIESNIGPPQGSVLKSFPAVPPGPKPHEGLKVRYSISKPLDEIQRDARFLGSFEQADLDREKQKHDLTTLSDKIKGKEGDDMDAYRRFQISNPGRFEIRRVSQSEDVEPSVEEERKKPKSKLCGLLRGK